LSADRAATRTLSGIGSSAIEAKLLSGTIACGYRVGKTPRLQTVLLRRESLGPGTGPNRPNENTMTDPIDINRWNCDGRPKIHSGARHFMPRHGYRTNDYASASELKTAVLDAAQ